MAQADTTTREQAVVDSSLLEVAREDVVTDTAALKAMYGEVQQLSIDKVTSELTPLMIEFLSASPMYFLATANKQGICDVSPRGDPAGSVVVSDATTLVLPDRRGNKRVDSIGNLVSNNRVGLVFLVPGIDDTLRINGRVTLSRHQPLLDTLTMQGKAPNLALIVDIDEAYMHCPRAFKRSGLWNSETWPAPGSVPSMSAILHEQLNMPGTVDELSRERAERAATTLY